MNQKWLGFNITHIYSLWQDLSNDTNIFDLVALTLTLTYSWNTWIGCRGGISPVRTEPDLVLILSRSVTEHAYSTHSSFIAGYSHLLIHFLACLLTRSYTRPLTHRTNHTNNHSFTHMLSRSFSRLLTYSLTHSFTHSHTWSLKNSLTCSLKHSTHQHAHSLALSLNHFWFTLNCMSLLLSIHSLYLLQDTKWYEVYAVTKCKMFSQKGRED